MWGINDVRIQRLCRKEVIAPLVWGQLWPKVYDIVIVGGGRR